MTPQDTLPPPRPYLGLVGFGLGGAALILVIAQYVAGPFAPQKDLSVGLGELASGITKSALRDLFGLAQPGAEPRPWDIDRVLEVVAILGGGLALMMGLGAFLRHENRRLAIFAASLGVSALAIQLFATTVAIIVGVLLVSAVLAALKDFVPSLDWFGG